jgi:hypothetical protein
MTEEKLFKFEKILTLNYTDADTINKCVNLLMNFMKDKNDSDKTHTEFFMMRLKYSEKNPFAKDLVLEWAVMSNEKCPIIRETTCYIKGEE